MTTQESLLVQQSRDPNVVMAILVDIMLRTVSGLSALQLSFLHQQPRYIN